MSDTILFSIDEKPCTAQKGQTIVQAAKDNGVYIPVLCFFEGIKAAGTCRICTVMVNGRPMAACTTPVANNMKVANNTPQLRQMRESIVEMLFVEGNHFCPSCEKSGQCDLQALAYRYRMMAPRFEYEFSQRTLDASPSKLILERNRCICCKRCVNGIRTEEGKNLFGISNRGNKTLINIDPALATCVSDDVARKSMEICPVGALIRKEQGFTVPIGIRKYDKNPIGSEIESNASALGREHS
jgi:[NiFe] hydrogenase diaphorase moiety small subunit